MHGDSNVFWGHHIYTTVNIYYCSRITYTGKSLSKHTLVCLVVNLVHAQHDSIFFLRICGKNFTCTATCLYLARVLLQESQIIFFFFQYFSEREKQELLCDGKVPLPDRGFHMCPHAAVVAGLISRPQPLHALCCHAWHTSLDKPSTMCQQTLTTCHKAGSVT